MEERYQKDINKWSLYNTQLGYITTVLSQVVPCFTYLGATPLPIGLWIKLSYGTVALGFFLNGLFNLRCRRYTVFINFVFAVVATSMMILMMFAPMHTGQPPQSSPQSDGPVSWLILLSFIQAPLTHLCLTGLNIWSLSGYSVILSAPIIIWVSRHSFTSTVENSLHLTFQVLSFMVLAVLLERIQRQKFLAEMMLERQMRASETADSILNHTLKNILADVGAYIELFLADRAPRGALEDALLCLRRGVKACRERQVYLKLVAGTYAPVANAVDLEAFTRDLVAGRQVRASVVTSTAHFDRMLLTLILDNAINNAIKHGSPENPDVALTIRTLPESEPDTPAHIIEFEISNAADPHRPPLMPEAVASLFSGAPRPQRLGRAPLLSDGIGLAHAKLAADIANIRMSLTQEGPRVVFRAVLDSSEPVNARRVSAPSDRYVVDAFHPPGPPSDITDLDAIPPNTSIFVLDDSGSSRQILELQLRHAFPGVQVTVLGAQESDIELFTAMAAGEAAIVILDQHLEYSGGSHLGTTVAERLRKLGYSGMICIRSADDSPEDQALYTAAGAHCFFCKDLPGKEMVRRLAAAYRDFTETLQRYPTGQNEP